MEKRCLICEAELRGRQRVFCSARCENSDTDSRHQNYEAQQARGRRRRESLIRRKGGRCERCGYSRDGAALAFHHVNPSTESFPLDIRKCSNSSWEALAAEAEKCVLLCLNCHAEIHHPEFST